MHAKTILEKIKSGKVVTYTIRRLRGYLHGDASLVFQPKDAIIGVQNIALQLTNFRLDESPYDKPRWEVV